MKHTKYSAKFVTEQLSDYSTFYLQTLSGGMHIHMEVENPGSLSVQVNLDAEDIDKMVKLLTEYKRYLTPPPE